VLLIAISEVLCKFVMYQNRMIKFSLLNASVGPHIVLVEIQIE
jgi:septum formation topological specificity factor MinE